MAEFQIALRDERATAAFGAALAPLLRRGDVVCLAGPLGAGKTTLARGVVRALAGVEEAPSPTFALALSYDGPDFALWHFDLYRLERDDDVFELGFEDALEDGACLIEWPERIARFVPETALLIRLSPQDGRRVLTARGDTAWMRRLAEAGLCATPESREQGRT
ncbi:MAG: tRNA (adenosine(37)-N6)-threonylcarbamoyltransferase complex ATPase subunit type 1 TsaE [Alphaproteobacteria bacterium]|nr:tRNA (adenosine(37)-N6)-threonylcarbamoyltransferase complex ATPase subunit type 1 TsaE [Alphaproteobacteria bacterium]